MVRPAHLGGIFQGRAVMFEHKDTHKNTDIHTKTHKYINPTKTNSSIFKQNNHINSILLIQPLVI